MPNLVHSLDAASLCIVINNYFNQDKFVLAPTPFNSYTNSTNKAESLRWSRQVVIVDRVLGRPTSRKRI